MNLIENERTKLLAATLNNAAVAIIVTAIIGPAVGVTYGLAGMGVANRWWFLVGAVWLLVGLGLHYSAQQVLGRLKDD